MAVANSLRVRLQLVQPTITIQFINIIDVQVHGLRSSELPDLESGKLVGVDSTGKQLGNTRRRRSRLRKPVYVHLLRAAIMILIISGIIAALALIWYYTGWIFLLQLAIVVAVAFFIAGKYYRWVYVAVMTAPRDIA